MACPYCQGDATQELERVTYLIKNLGAGYTEATK